MPDSSSSASSPQGWHTPLHRGGLLGVVLGYEVLSRSVRVSFMARGHEMHHPRRPCLAGQDAVPATDSAGALWNRVVAGTTTVCACYAPLLDLDDETDARMEWAFKLVCAQASIAGDDFSPAVLDELTVADRIHQLRWLGAQAPDDDAFTRDVRAAADVELAALTSTHVYRRQMVRTAVEAASAPCSNLFDDSTGNEADHAALEAHRHRFLTLAGRGTTCSDSLNAAYDELITGPQMWFVPEDGEWCGFGFHFATRVDAAASRVAQAPALLAGRLNAVASPDARFLAIDEGWSVRDVSWAAQGSHSSAQFVDRIAALRAAACV